MAIMNCYECSNPVSSTAAACPHCGAPIAHTNTTIQKTSKRLKLQYGLASGLFMIAFVWFIVAIVAGAGESDDTKIWITIPILMLLASTTWAITTKLRIWWHHE